MNLERFSKVVSRVFLGSWLVILIIFGLLRTGPTKFPLELNLPIFLAQLGMISIAFKFLKSRGHITDWDITKREERYIYFAIIAGITLFATILSYFLVNFEFFVLNLTLLVLAISLSLFTFIFKISGHLILNVSGIFLLNYLFDWKLLWLFLVVPAVAFARIYLKKHTLWQVVAGATVGFVEPFFILKLFDLI